MPHQLLFFILVGSVAAATHWGIVIALVSQLGLSPLLANLLGWLCAFIVSFSGHHLLTFQQHGTYWLTALRRFFLISALGFCINETAYALLLHYSLIPYQWLLAGILVSMAFLTFILSRLWAFASK